MLGKYLCTDELHIKTKKYMDTTNVLISYYTYFLWGQSKNEFAIPIAVLAQLKATSFGAFLRLEYLLSKAVHIEK